MEKEKQNLICDCKCHSSSLPPSDGKGCSFCFAEHSESGENNWYDSEAKRVISYILIDKVGRIDAFKQIEHHDDPLKRQPYGTYRIDHNPITQFTVNGEMAPVLWYRQGNREWNGKYIIEIGYKDEK